MNDKKLILNEIIKGSEHFNALENEFNALGNFEHFSENVNLAPYQQEAVKYAYMALRLYFDGVLGEKYEEIHAKIEGTQTNRASFWMATGSGKTLVMIRLIALLQQLMRMEKIPKKPIMLLVPNEVVLTQFRQRIKAFNVGRDTSVEVMELRDFESAVYMNLFGGVVFVGRSDLLDVAKNVGKNSSAKRLNYKNLLQKEGWYILLDEAHKGESESSVRKRHFNELAAGLSDEFDMGFNAEKRGFIFNFSATFDDEIDFVSCAYNYNLSKFNEQGFGKNIFVMESNLQAFKKGSELSEADKKARVSVLVESFVLFYAIKESKRRLFEKYNALGVLSENSVGGVSNGGVNFSTNLNGGGVNLRENLLYHNPLIIAVSDEVSTQNAGIKLYFEAILGILQDESVNLDEIKKNLVQKIKNARVFYNNAKFDDGFFEIIESAELSDIRKVLFYAQGAASVEACKIRGNDKEIAFKSKNATKPFLLLNVGDKKQWEKHYLTRLGVESGEDLAQGYFDGINEANSPINIMMGSKVFSEGWDSNRVNLISFINIGSINAKKYVLQTLGRGVRCEPFKNQRMRLEFILKEHEFFKLKGFNRALESLFVMASDKKAIEGILGEIERNIVEKGRVLANVEKNSRFDNLPVPKYTEVPNDRDFVLHKSDYESLMGYLNSYDENVFLLSEGANRRDLGFGTLEKIRKKERLCVVQSCAIKWDSQKAVNKAFGAVDRFFYERQKRLAGYKRLDDEIKHFRHFTSTFSEEITKDLNKAIKEVVQIHKNLLNLSGGDKESLASMRRLNNRECKQYTIKGSLAEHYYVPMILRNKGENAQGTISYAINEQSEIEFLDKLETFLQKDDNALNDYEWCFCRLVQNVDEIFVPYFDSTKGEMRKFYPDFIFWLKHRKNGAYKILFIDPKGLTLAPQNAVDKKEGFERIFGGKNLNYEGQAVSVNLVYFNESGTEDERLKDCTKSDIKGVFELLVE